MSTAGLSLKEKYALLRKKQGGVGPEKTIVKKSVATPSEDSKREELLRLLAQTREMEEAKNAAKPVRKLPGALQRALEEDPDIIKKQKSVVPPVSGGPKEIGRWTHL